MALSAPKILYDEANRLKTDQLWIRYVITVNGQPTDISQMGFGVEAESDERAFVTDYLPALIVEGENDIPHVVEILNQTPGAVKLGTINDRTQKIFYLRLFMGGSAGQVSLHQLKLTIDPRRTKDSTVYNDGGMYPEEFHINIDTDEEPETINGSVVWPGLNVAGFARIESIHSFDILRQLPIPNRDTLYSLAQTVQIGGKTYDSGLYFRNTAGEIIPLATAKIPLP